MEFALSFPKFSGFDFPLEDPLQVVKYDNERDYMNTLPSHYQDERIKLVKHILKIYWVLQSFVQSFKDIKTDWYQINMGNDVALYHFLFKEPKQVIYRLYLNETTSYKSSYISFFGSNDFKSITIFDYQHSQSSNEDEIKNNFYYLMNKFIEILYKINKQRRDNGKDKINLYVKKGVIPDYTNSKMLWKDLSERGNFKNTILTKMKMDNKMEWLPNENYDSNNYPRKGRLTDILNQGLTKTPPKNQAKQNEQEINYGPTKNILDFLGDANIRKPPKHFPVTERGGKRKNRKTRKYLKKTMRKKRS